MFGILVGSAHSGTDQSDCREASEVLARLGVDISVCPHKRGLGFHAINSGVSVGGGPKEPYTKLHGDWDEEAHEALGNKAIRNLVISQDGKFVALALLVLPSRVTASLKLFAPRLHEHLKHNMHQLCKKYDKLRRNWQESVYSTVAFNLGRNVTCLFHRDAKDLAYSLCAIHALGDFDHTKGGHLVLKEPRLIIQFPSGSLILIPSSVITHGNTAIQPGENRQSLTQYMMGGIVRFVNNGFKNLVDLSTKEKVRADEANVGRWERGTELWCTAEELAHLGI